MTTAELMTAGLSYHSNAGSATIVSDINARKRAHFYLTKAANRVWEAAPFWWRHADSTVTLSAGIGTMPTDFDQMGTQGRLYVQGRLYYELRYRAPDWIKFQIQNNPQSGIPEVYTLDTKTPLGVPKILCWPQDNSTLVLTSYVRKKPELIDTPLAVYPVADAATGNPDGTYTYQGTYVTAAGETEGGDVSASVTVATKKINVGSIRSWWGRTVTSFKLYRNAAGGTQRKLVTTLNVPLPATYLDDVADIALGADVPTVATAVTGLEVFPEMFHDSALFDGLVYLLSRVKGDGREVQFDAKWEQGIRRMWEQQQQGLGEVKAFPAFPGFGTGHPVWSRWQPPR